MSEDQGARISALVVLVPAMAMIVLPGVAHGGIGAQLAMLFTELLLGVPTLIHVPGVLRASVIPLRWPKRISQLTLAVLILAGTPLFQLISALNAYLLPIPEDIQNSMREALGTSTTLSAVLTWVSLVLVAPIMEEVFFRGLLQWLWTRRIHNARSFAALIVPAAVFALFHLNPWQFPSLLLLGLWLSWLRAWSGSLLPGVVFHMAINLLALLLL